MANETQKQYGCVYFPQDNTMCVVRESHKTVSCEKFQRGETCDVKWKDATYKGTIILVGESRKDLEKKMKDRQALGTNLSAGGLVSADREPLPEETAIKLKHHSETKRKDTLSKEQEDTKRRKKEINTSKLDAAKQNFQAMIDQIDDVPDKETDVDIENVEAQLSVEEPSRPVPIYTEDWYQSQRRDSAFQPYSFLTDIYRPQSTAVSYHTLQTPHDQLTEALARNSYLEEENRQLQSTVSSLQQEVLRLRTQPAHNAPTISASKEELSFLKRITRILEDNVEQGGSLDCAPSPCSSFPRSGLMPQGSTMVSSPFGSVKSKGQVQCTRGTSSACGLQNQIYSR